METSEKELVRVGDVFGRTRENRLERLQRRLRIRRDGASVHRPHRLLKRRAKNEWQAGLLVEVLQPMWAWDSPVHHLFCPICKPDLVENCRH